MVMKNTLTLALLSGMLTACINLGPMSAQANHSYQLTGQDDVRLPVLAKKPYAIAIKEGYVAPAFRTTGLAYQTQPQQIQYFVQHRWQSPPSSMITNVLAQALQQSNDFQAVVVVPPYMGQVDYTVYVNLLNLTQVFSADHQQAEEQVSLQIVINHLSSNKLKAAKTFRVRLPAAANPQGGVAAVHQALQQLLPDIAAYVYQGCD